MRWQNLLDAVANRQKNSSQTTHHQATQFINLNLHIFLFFPSAFCTQFYPQLVYKAPLSFTLRIRMWVVAYFDPSKKFKKIKDILGKFLVRKLQYLKKIAHKKLKKPPSKVDQRYSIFSFITALSCPNRPSQRNNVPKCGLQTNCI